MAVCEASAPGTTLPPGAVEVISRRLAADGTALAAAAATLSAAERLRAGCFATASLRERYIIARATLRELLGERLGIAPQAVELACGPYGKPALAGAVAGRLHFSLSHSEDLAVFALAHAEVGIDIERLRPLPVADRIVERFFSRHEQAAYRALPAAQKLLGFFNAWTRKEAFIKAAGEGLHHPLDTFDVSLEPGVPACLLRVGQLSGEASGWTLRSFQPGPGFVGALVVRRPPAQLH
ncbi:MAG TPA: 4'-phosphopantetheinyl transferase superfamily protein [Azonexus sp.]